MALNIIESTAKGRDLKPKTLRSILADSGLTPDQFHELL
jgi:predicted RNA binding protein YcfA (HicA-like mRNA interferase family)